MRNLCFILFTFNLISFTLEYDSIKRYDDVIYERQIIEHSKELSISFYALNRYFILKLNRLSKEAFKENILEVDSYKILVDLDIYEGILSDDNNSKVHGSIIDGLFYGTIHSSHGNYIIEAKRGKKGTIIYDEKDVDTSKLNKAFQSKVIKSDEHRIVESQNRQKRNDNLTVTENYKKRFLKPFVGGSNICSMYLKVDPFFYNEIFKDEGGGNHEKTIKFIVAFVHKNVNYLNAVFKKQILTETGESINFVPFRIKVITNQTCESTDALEADKVLCDNTNKDHELFLDRLSYDLDFKSYCLGFGVSGRDFQHVVGCAFTTKVGGNNCGVCDSNVYIDDSKILSVQNTAMCTLISNNRRSSELLFYQCFVHEIGHNFGAKHDSIFGGECVPDDEKGGTYIMGPGNGHQPNNHIFSNCSVRTIIDVINELPKRKRCFLSKQNLSFCGNRIIDRGEECDCGFDEDCKDKCCYSASDKINGCKLRSNSTCSPSQGSCCTDECVLKSSSTICSPKSSCSNDVYCTGESAECPTKDPKYYAPLDLNNLPQSCNEGTQICNNGSCVGSICEKYQMIECMPIETDYPCHIHCEGGPNNRQCTDSYLLQEFNSKGVDSLYGSVCEKSGRGYCSITGKCKIYDSNIKEFDYDFLTLYVFGYDYKSYVIKFLKKHYWILVLIILFSGLIQFISFRICS